MKLTSRPKLKRVWIALVALIGMIAVVRGSYAAYISQDAQRGVARNRDTDRIRFSSNLLQASSATEEKQYANKVIAYSKNTADGTELPINIYVYNYLQGSANLVNENDITYNMSIKITGGTKTEYIVKYEDEQLKPTKNDDNSYSYEKNGVKLPGRAQSLHHYTVTVYGADLDKVRIIATAKPTNTSYTGGQFLAATISPCTSSEVKSFSCEGTFTDSSNGKPKDYDAFNYEVSISGGRANVTLTWDSTKVEIDPYFLEKIGKSKENISIDNTNTSSLQFEMDQNEGTGDYLITFYRLSNNDSLPDMWTSTSESDYTMASIIKVSGDQIATTGIQTENTN